MADPKRLLIVQPYLTKYRLPVFREIAESFDLDVLASKSTDYGSEICDDSFAITTVSERQIFSVFYWQSGLISALRSTKYDLLFITANPRYLSTWFALYQARLLGIKVVLHGQGLYRKESHSLSTKLIYALFNLFSDRYLAYTALSKESMRGLSIYQKTVVTENSIVNSATVDEKRGSEKGVLFVGRLRDGSNVESLIEAVMGLNEEQKEQAATYTLHIVGAGVLLSAMKQKYAKLDFVKFYGEIYDSSRIAQISKSCFVGCYPGDAGLSILHYMSLSLPPVVHSNMRCHMGPEPSYIKDGFNGVLFERGDKKSLQNALRAVSNNQRKLRSLQQNAFETYKAITNPSLGQRMTLTLNEVSNS